MNNPQPGLSPISRSRESASSEVAQVLLAHLVSGQYRPGQRLPPERALAESLGVGRQLIREALKALTLLGLVEVRPGDGNYLRQRPSNLLPESFEWGLLLGENQLEDVIEAREELEVILAGLAAKHRTETDIADLRSLLARMREARNGADFVGADVAFHLRVAQAARNSVLQNMLSGTQSLLHAWISRVIAAEDDTKQSYQEHEPVFRAIEEGSVTDTRAAIRKHLRQAAARLRDALAEYPGLPPR